jgi:hypothetical protein
MSKSLKFSPIVYRDKGVVIYKRSDGRYQMQITCKKLAAKFSQACNLISEKLGRPVSKVEALDYMLKNAIEYL